MSDFNDMPQSSVPSSVPQQVGGGGTDYGELIQHIATPIDPSLVRAAMTPMAGPHTGQVPSNLQQPIGPHQNSPMIRTDNIVGRKQGKLAGIGNAFIGATNALGAVVSAEAQTKQNNTRDAAQKVIMAQSSIDEAQQQHDMAAQAGDTAAAARFQAEIDKNTKVRDGVFADPKMRKALTKGFDISYTDPTSNKTPDHAAVQEALKNAKTLQEKKQIMQQQQEKAGTEAGKAYASQQPTTLVPNQLAQQQLMQAQANQKANIEATRALMPFLAAQTRANAAASIEQRREAFVDSENLMKGQQAWDRVQAQISGRLDLARTIHGYRLGEIAAQGTKELTVFKSKLATKSTDPEAIVKAYTDFQTKTANTQDALAKHVSDLIAQQDLLSRQPKADPNKIAMINQQIELAKQAQEAFKDSVDSIQTWYNKSASVQGGGSDGTGSSSSGTSIDSSASYLDDSAPDPDEE